MTERYLREAPVEGAIPQIYPSTLVGLTSMLKDSVSASTTTEFEWRCWAIHRNRLRTLIAIFQNGERVWAPDNLDQEPSLGESCDQCGRDT